MHSILERIYGRQKAAAAAERITSLVEVFGPVPAPHRRDFFTQTDTILITYGDSLQQPQEPPLQTLHRFAKDHFKGIFSGIHLLPIFPFSSDDGFAVTDFMAVRPELGTWEDIRRIAGNFKLMLDLVLNHVSAHSRWFQNYLSETEGYEDLAIEVDPATDLSAVTRPRALPLLTLFKKASGRQVHLWTTFSADQVDLNYDSLDVLEKMVRALLFYVSQGARLIRLDAVAYLFKQIGTPCIHLPRTHDMVRLFRRILDIAAPGVALVTETNVPHVENVSYFGNGKDEAQMVYNFTLPPLLLYCLSSGNARLLSEWARGLETPTSRTTFLNFTASHDGIGVRPLEGILGRSEIAWLTERVLKNGGDVSRRRGPDGSESPYELNITYLDALRNPVLPEDPLHSARFLASQAVALVLPGVPAVYIHSILGSRNWTDGVRRTGRARSINRESLALGTVKRKLADAGSIRARIFYPYRHMLSIRTRQAAFHPAAGFRVVDLDDRVFAIKRFCPEQTLFAVTNLSSDPLTFSLPGAPGGRTVADLLSRERLPTGAVPLAPYAARWLNMETG